MFSAHRNASGLSVAVAALWSLWAWGTPARIEAATVLIEIGDLWKYFPGMTAPSEPATIWREKDFDDAAWQEGPTGIGYGDGDDATPLIGMEDAYLAVYTRKAFDLADPAAVESLVLEIDFDDGFVAYVNGSEVARNSMGAVGQEFGFGDEATALRESGTTLRVNLTGNLGLLQQGRNVLAVEVHNFEISSSDLSFIPRLIANDETLTCPTGLAATAALPANEVVLSWTNNGPYERIEITRDGVPVAGSPFAGGVTSARDATPGTLDAVYQLVATQAGLPCPPITDTSTVQERGLGTLQCSLSLVGGTTEATLTWTNIPDTVSAAVRREGTLLNTLTGGETQYVDPDVEALEPEDDTDFSVTLTDSRGGIATITCGALPLCLALTCEVVQGPAGPQIRLLLGNPVKEWETIEVSRAAGGPTVVLDILPGTATEYVDASPAEPGVTATYTVSPMAPAGRQPVAGCDRTCSLSLPVPETASYSPPQGGWDYAIDFESHSEAAPLDRYTPLTGETGNLDGMWFRSVDRDFWDGSRPDDAIGPAPAGPAPGGVGVVSRPDLGPCGEDIKALRIVDPGNPAMPAGSLAVDFPDAYPDPSNKAIFLGFDTGVTDRNLLRSGVTFSARWRVAPDPPAYLGALPAGDGEPMVAGALGSIGFHFRNTDPATVAAGPGVSASFGLNTGDELQFSADDDVGGPFELATASITAFRSLWVTVVDPENDGTYDVTIYTNGRTTPFAFGTRTALTLEDEAFDFGAATGNYLAVGLADVVNDGTVEIDYIAYKVGVHPPAASECSPCTNAPPIARIAVTPPGAQVTLAGGTAQVTLGSQGSQNGEGGTQGLTFAWSKVSGPAGDVIQTPGAASTPVTFNAAGSYRYRLTVNDGQTCQATASTEVAITVLPQTGGGRNFKRGDVDASGGMNITDAVVNLGYQFLGSATISCFDAADADDSGRLNITDAVRILGSLFLGDGPLPAPGPVCGPDPGPADTLDCQESSCP